MVENALGAEVGLLPIAVGELVQPDSAATGRRMHEAPFPHIYRCMTDLPTTAGGEEQQVARLQCTARNIDPERAHGSRGARQTHSRRAAIDVTDQPAAIETIVRCIT